MSKLDVFVAQVAPKLGDKESNFALIKEAMHDAKKANAKLVVFPELVLTGYDIGEIVGEIAETVDGPYVTKVRNLCKELGLYVALSYPEIGDDGNYYISSSLIDDQGEVLGTYRKMHLFDAETNYFKAGSTFEVIETPFGSVGMMICFDVEFPEIARALKLKGADMLVIVNANMHPYEMHHHIFARSRAMENELPVIICNRLGVENDLDFCGDSMVIDATGEILLSLGNEEKSDAATIVLEQKLDPKMSYTANRRKELYGLLTEK